MKAIYENPEFMILETAVCDVITASVGEPPKKVIISGEQSSEETSVGWGSMW